MHRNPRRTWYFLWAVHVPHDGDVLPEQVGHARLVGVHLWSTGVIKELPDLSLVSLPEKSMTCIIIPLEDPQVIPD